MFKLNGKWHFSAACLSLFLGSFSLEGVAADDKFKTLPHSYTHAVKSAAPAVVNIFTDREVKSQQKPDGRGRMNPRKIAEDDIFLINRKTRRSTLGSGVIINNEGYILTNNHVTRNATRILVALADGRKTQAKVIGRDSETDLALLKIDLKNLTFIELGNSDAVQVGDVVLAIGNPFGLGQTVTQGIVSAIGRSRIGINQLENYIQTDAAINPGNSGGALVDTRGKLIGINTGIYTRTGGYQGVGFAIPVNVAMNVMGQLIKFGFVKHGWLGANVVTLTHPIAKRLGSEVSTGVVITRVGANTPAAKVGLKRYDIVTHLNNRRVYNIQGFLSYIAQKSPGNMLSMTVIRKNVKQEVSVKLGLRPKGRPHDDRGAPPGLREENKNRSSTQSAPYVPDDRSMTFAR